jgi:hypothetical protein
MIPAMKSSPFDTFCRALVLGAVLGALGWGAVRYTNLPQIALQKIVALSHAAQGHPANNNYPKNPQVTSAITPITPPQWSIYQKHNTGKLTHHTFTMFLLAHHNIPPSKPLTWRLPYPKTVLSRFLSLGIYGKRWNSGSAN